jgi:hypothetical protein
MTLGDKLNTSYKTHQSKQLVRPQLAVLYTNIPTKKINFEMLWILSDFSRSQAQTTETYRTIHIDHTNHWLSLLRPRPVENNAISGSALKRWIWAQLYLHEMRNFNFSSESVCANTWLLCTCNKIDPHAILYYTAIFSTNVYKLDVNVY